MLMLDYPLRVDFKKIESGYSKFLMLLPNVQSPRLSRLVCVDYAQISLLDLAIPIFVGILYFFGILVI